LILQSIAVWLITEDQKVLLKKTKKRNAQKCGKYNIYQPFKGWLGITESLRGRIHRLMGEEFGKSLTEQYPYGRYYEKLSLIREVNFSLPKGAARCYHFLGRITNEQLLEFVDPEKVRLVGREDLSKIKKLGMKSENDDIVLFGEDYEILHWLFSILNK